MNWETLSELSYGDWWCRIPGPNPSLSLATEGFKVRFNPISKIFLAKCKKESIFREKSEILHVWNYRQLERILKKVKGKRLTVFYLVLMRGTVYEKAQEALLSAIRLCNLHPKFSLFIQLFRFIKKTWNFISVISEITYLR